MNKHRCFLCDAKIGEYFVDPKFIEGRFFYCIDYPESHPWIWEKPDGSVEIRE